MKRKTLNKRILASIASFSLCASLLNFNVVNAVEQSNESTFNNKVAIEKIAGFFTGTQNKDGGAAEIVKYNKDNNKFYVINGVESKIHVVSLDGIGEDYTDLTSEKEISVKALVENNDFKYGDITSISISNERKEIAVTVQEEDYTKNGKIVILNYDGELIEIYNCGIQPDMITYTSDSKYLLTANEGEPREGYNSVDPEGSVTLVNLESKESKNIGFDGVTLEGDVILRNNGTNSPVVDLEPEYITISDDNKKAYVSLQENNAIAVVDIEQGAINTVKGLGFKDHSLEENSMDVVKDGEINLETLPIKGVYMPDSIQYYNGYIITANEGDASEWGDYSNVGKLKDIKSSLVLNADNFGGYETQEELDAKLNEIQNTTTYDKLEVLTEVGSDAIYTLGGRSFSVWDAETLELVYDSGNDFETITGERYPDYFNVSNSKIEKDDRSTKKGPEPEEVKIGQVGHKTYAFVGLERIGGFMTYDITDPSNISFVNYTNSRDFSDKIAGDSGPEGMDFISAENSVTGYPMLVVSNEVSGTVAVYEIYDGYVSSDKEITIFHTNDVHSRVDNYSKFKAYIDNYDNKVVLDAGDTLHGLSFVTLEKGSSIVKVMNEIGYDAISPGNHDFNYGYLRLKELGNEANFNILAANVTKDGNAEFEQNIIKEVDGVKVGVFGLATPETAYKTNPNNVEGLDFGTKESIIETSQEMVNNLEEQGAEVIIGLMHMGIDTSSEVKSTDIAENVEGIDLIVDGHSHSTLDKYEEFNNNHETKIASTGEYLSNLGQVTISIDEEGNKEIDLKSVNMSELTQTDENIDNLINTIKAEQDVILSEEVGETPIKLEGAREQVRWGHTNLGRLITSAMLNETGADIALTNGGGIRASIEEGKITKGDVITVLPFGNYIVTKNMKGSDIIKALEHGLVEGTGSFTHFAGMEVYGEKYTDESGNVRWKVNNVVINGELLDENKTYTVATNDFIAAGGDSYTMFNDYPTLNEYSLLDEALINYISKIDKETILAIDGETRLIEGEMPEDSTDDEEDDNTNNEQKPGDNENNTPNEDDGSDNEDKDKDASENPSTDKNNNNAGNTTVVTKPNITNTSTTNTSNKVTTTTKTGDNNVAIPVLLGLIALGSLGVVATLKKKKKA